MPIISDYEVLRSSLVYGDLDDTFSLLKQRKRAIEIAQKARPSKKRQAYYEYLELLEQLLRGEMSLDQFKAGVESIPGFPEMLDLTGDTALIAKSFYYLLEYSLDRYNVRYPSYDGKRCDDK